MAFVTIYSNRKMAKRRGTLDLIMHIESDGDLIAARKEFIKLKKGEFNSAKWGKEDEKDSEEANNIRTTLNVNELVAVSIKEGVIDEMVFRRWFNGAYIDDYQTMTGYLNEVRNYKNNPKIFCEFEALAKKWQDDKDWDGKPNWMTRKWKAICNIFAA
ncbi:hypothetical protein LPB140_11130 [Sphingorhabdus lutea]|uniref:DUF4760 domain-containing protein n=1 Tax=Sphingorhabdus lutea TaxID=1913578 RepID=A0A1L3JDN1_9SPHN|nr:DUF4760 domain-containing protein [Sphingorhabdus lutea]APG63248.1 hypothetical protein LPB140_11130 [Sphingorhabdus lutea]